LMRRKPHGNPQKRRRHNFIYQRRPAAQRPELVKGEKDGKRALIVRDAQHEYVFVETS